LIMVNTAQQNIATLLWMVKTDSPIKSLGDLKGKSISMTAAQSLTQMADLMMLDAKGYAKGDARLIAAGGFGPTLTLLDTGNLDVAAAGVQAYFIAPPGRYRILGYASDVLPPIVSTLGVTSQKAAKTRPEAIRAIIAVRRRAVDYTYAHPKEAADIMAKTAKWPVEGTEQAVAAMVDKKLWSRGDFDPAAYDNAVKGLVLTGQLKADDSDSNGGRPEGA
jgi:NitT/TauT family transport system substrate-binding protein